MKRLPLFLFVIAFLPFVSSTILFQDSFEDVYNIGDMISVSYSIESSVDVSDFVEVILKCDSDEFVVSKTYEEFDANDKESFNLTFPAKLEGDCKVEVVFRNDEEETGEFEISDLIEIDFSLNDKTFSPGDSVEISGDLDKKNDNSFEGILKITLEDLFQKSIEVEDGNFEIEFDIPEDASPGEYDLILEVKELNNLDEVLNKGSKTTEIEIESVPSDIVINAEESLTPPSNFEFNVYLVDQVGDEIEEGSIIVKIFDPENNIVLEKKVQNNEEINYSFSSDATKAGWSIKAYYGDLFSSKSIYVSENKEVLREFLNGKLRFSNVGNVKYVGIETFNVSNSSYEDEISVNLDLDVGEIYDYSLELIGDYNLSGERIDFQNVYLTGAAVFFDYEVTPKSYLITGIILLLGILIYFGIKKRKLLKKYFSKIKLPKRKEKKKEAPKVELVFDKNNKRVYSIFVRFDYFSQEMREILEKHKMTFHRVGENVGYVMFFSTPGKNAELKIFNLAKLLRRVAYFRGHKISILLNSKRYDNKLSSLKDFAMFNRKLLNEAGNNIFISEKIFKHLNLHIPRKIKEFSIDGEKVMVYVV